MNVETKVKCPKCKGKDLYLEELWKDHYIKWEVVNGSFDRKDGALEVGDAYKVIGICKKCDHVWTIMGALQIDDVIK